MLTGLPRLVVRFELEFLDQRKILIILRWLIFSADKHRYLDIPHAVVDLMHLVGRSTEICLRVLS